MTNGLRYVSRKESYKGVVSSTVYDFEPQLDMVYSTLDGYGYDVMMSHKRTISLDSKLIMLFWNFFEEKPIDVSISNFVIYTPK